RRMLSSVSRYWSSAVCSSDLRLLGGGRQVDVGEPTVRAHRTGLELSIAETVAGGQSLDGRQDLDRRVRLRHRPAAQRDRADDEEDADPQARVAPAGPP